MACSIGDRVLIRWMLRSDMPDVMEIEDSTPRPLPEGEIIRTIGDRGRRAIGMVAEYGGRVVGCYLYELLPGRLAILRLAVTPGLRRRGIGRRMVEELIGKLSPRRRTRIDFDAPDDDLGLHLFLKACGFRAVMLPTADTYRFTCRIAAAVPDDCGGVIR